MNLKSRVRALERSRAGDEPAAAACPACQGLGGGRVRIIRMALPGEPTSPGPFPEGCPACGRLAPCRLTILLRAGMDPANPGGRVPPVCVRTG